MDRNKRDKFSQIQKNLDNSHVVKTVKYGEYILKYLEILITQISNG